MIIECDYPKEMPEFLSILLQGFSTLNLSFPVLQAYFFSAKCLINAFKFKIFDEKGPLTSLIPDLFPHLEKYLEIALEKYNEQTAVIAHFILKIFFSITYLELPTYFLDENNLHRWMVFVRTILDSPIPQDLEETTQDEQEIVKREKNVFWKNRNCCAMVLESFLLKYSNSKFEKQKNKGLALIIQEKYLFCEAFLDILIRRNNLFVSQKLLYFSMKYLHSALINIPKSSAILTPHLSKLVFEIAIPMLQLTPQDQNLWFNAPEQFLKKEDESQTKKIHFEVIKVLEVIFRRKNAKKQNFLNAFFHYAQVSIINDQDINTKQPLHFLHKEALLLALGMLKNVIIFDKNLLEKIETFINQIILPEVYNQNPFIRGRACWFLGIYDTVNYKDSEIFKHTVEGVLLCLEESNLPVRVRAAVALCTLLMQEGAIDIMRPYLAKILDNYMNLIGIIDNEAVLEAFEGILTCFHNEIAPFAFDLIKLLIIIFQKSCKKLNLNTEMEDLTAEISMAGSLALMRKILMVQLPQNIYNKLQEEMIPIFNYCLTEDGSEFIDEALSCLNLLLHNSNEISDSLLFYYPVLNYLITGLPNNTHINENNNNLSIEQNKFLMEVKKGWGVDYLEDMTGCFRNFMLKTKESFILMKDSFGESFPNLLFKTINRVYEIFPVYENTLSLCSATVFIVTLIECNPGKLDGFLPKIIENAIERTKISNFYVKMTNFEIIAMALWHSPWLTLVYLSQIGLEEVLIRWFRVLKKLKKRNNMKTALLGLGAIFKVREEQLPGSMMGLIGKLGEKIVLLMKKIIKFKENVVIFLIN